MFIFTTIRKKIFLSVSFRAAEQHLKGERTTSLRDEPPNMNRDMV